MPITRAHVMHLAGLDAGRLAAEYSGAPVPPGVVEEMWEKTVDDAGLTPEEQQTLRDAYVAAVRGGYARHAAARAVTAIHREQDHYR